MTIHQLIKLNKENGGHFFDQDTMAAFDDKISDFRIKPTGNPNFVFLTNPKRGKEWLFSTDTGRQSLSWYW